MLTEFFDWDPIVLVHLEALNKEETSFDMDGLILGGKFVATIVDFRDQVLHLITMERCHSNKHLVEHNTERPCVNLDTVASLLEELRA